MRVLLASHSIIIDSHQIGGLERWMTTLAKSLGARGHVCDLFFFADGPLRVQEVSGHRFLRGDLASLMEWVDRSGTEIVHAKTLDWFTGISAVRLIPHGPRLVLTHHGITSHNWNSTNCDVLVGCSRWGAEEQQRSTDLTVQVATNGIDLSQFTPAEGVAGHPIIAWVGRASDLKQKRIDRLAAVAAGLVRTGIRIWIADPDGPQSLPPDLRQTLLENVERWEKIPPDAIAGLYQDVARSGGCVLSTSDSEGLPLALIEAQACGCPVIGTNVRGVNEAVSPEGGGILFSGELSPKRLCDLIATTLFDSGEMAMRRVRARAHVVAHFDLERMTANYEGIYRRTVAEQSRQCSTRARRPARGSHQEFIAENWVPGHRQWAASLELARRSNWDLAAIAMRAALTTYPPLAAKPSRIPHLLHLLSRKTRRAASRSERTVERAPAAERKL